MRLIPFFNTKCIFLLFYLSTSAFPFPLTNLFIYLFTGLLIPKFLALFIHKFNWFSQSKILCDFECLFCSFAVHVCLCMSVTYLHVCLYTPLYFVCACCLFVQDLYMFLCKLVCICVHVCVFLFTILC